VRVLMLGWEFPPHISGGLGTACLGISTGLADRGHDIVFILPRMENEEKEEAPGVHLRSASGIPVPHLVKEATAQPAFKPDTEAFRRLFLRPVSSSLQPYAGCERGAAFSAEDHTAEISSFHGGYHDDLMEEVHRFTDAATTLILEEHARCRANVIHAHDWMTFPAAMAASRLTGLPFVAHLHASEFDRCGDHGYHKIYRIEQEGLRAAQHVITVSRRTKRVAVQRYGISPEKITTVYNGAFPLKTKPVFSVPKLIQKENRVLFMGRITWQKGPGFFVEAARLVLDERPDTRFIMAGDGDMLPAMIERVAELRMGRRFHFTGFMHGEHVRRMYAISSLYVMPSVSEPFGITPLEALQCGTPVLLSKQSGCSEVLPHAPTIDFWDVRGMADAILTMLEHPEKTAENLLLCQQDLQDLTWNRSAEGIAAVYSRIGSFRS